MVTALLQNMLVNIPLWGLKGFKEYMKVFSLTYHQILLAVKNNLIWCKKGQALQMHIFR